MNIVIVEVGGMGTMIADIKEGTTDGWAVPRKLDRIFVNNRSYTVAHVVWNYDTLVVTLFVDPT